MRDIIELRQKFPDQKIVALIQLTHLSRFEYAGTKTFDNQWMYADNDCFRSVKPERAENWPTEAAEWIKQTIILYNPVAELEKLLSNVVGLVALFETLDVEYRIFSGPKLDSEVTWPEHNIFDRYLKTKSNVLNLATFSMLMDLTGVCTHPDAMSMQKIADYFINQLGGPR
jgi:hypothetical protein